MLFEKRGYGEYITPAGNDVSAEKFAPRFSAVGKGHPVTEGPAINPF